MADSEGLTRAIDPVTGIVLRVDDIPALQRLPRLNVAIATPCDPLPLGALAPIQSGGGAGRDRAQAVAAAVCEVLERYCGVFSPPFEVGTWREQVGFRHSPADLNGMYDSNARGFTPMTETARGRWCRGVVAGQGTLAFAPWSLVCLGAMPETRQPEDEFYLGPCVSTGLAAGRDLDDAAARGLFECIERDGAMMGWYSRQFAGRVSEDDLRVLFGDLFEDLDRCGLRVLMLDATPADIGIPVHVCAVFPAGDAGRVAFGMASSATAFVSVEKALLEAIQTWAWTSAANASGDALIRATAGRHMDDFSDRVVAYGSGRMRGVVHTFFDQARRAAEVGLKRDAPSSFVSVDAIAAALSAAGHTALLFDVTTDDVRECGVTVVRALCPTLQAMEAAHGWARPNEKRARKLGRQLLATDVPHPFP